MRSDTRSGLLARLVLTIAALLPYWQLLTFHVIYVTDDYFASDIFNGEFPGRVLVGNVIRSGHLPVWTSLLCSGIPLAGAPVDPIGLAAFSLLPPAPALDFFIIVLLLVAAHGAYSLARRCGADRPGAVLAGLAFAGSGYLACQLKHLSIVATVVWLPVGLVAIDRVLRAERPEPSFSRRALWTIAFGLVFAEQALCGFPQSAYICALVYASFALFRAIADRRSRTPRQSLLLIGGLGAIALIAAAAGAVELLPLSALGNISDRAEPLGYVWSTRLAYWPPNILMFLLPYGHGDISNNTYAGPPFFWEDYGYVGIATLLLAIYAVIRGRRNGTVLFLTSMTVVGYLFVLGAATPVFHAAYLLIPGMKLFRFPTRFLVVVDLGLAILGGVGVAALGDDIARRLPGRSLVPVCVAVALCGVTTVDLWYHQPRQNPMVPAREWLAPPPAIEAIRADTAQPRTFTPRHRDLHRRTFLLARGWSNVDPYFAIRDLLEPNLGGGLWNLPSGDGYVGVSARWYVDVWGDHNREASLMSALAYLDFNAGALRVHPRLPNILRTYGVTHVLTPYPQADEVLPFMQRAGGAYIYRVPDAQRVRFVRGATVVASERGAAARLLDPRFDPSREIVLEDTTDRPDPPADSSDVTAGAQPATAVITRETGSELIVDADAPRNGYLLLADTYYPGWTAEVDGQPTTLYRADVSIRGIRLPKGRHQVRFAYDPPRFFAGLWISLSAVATLLLCAAAALVMDRRASRYRASPMAPQTPITT
jgi:hypothetical protein